MCTLPVKIYSKYSIAIIILQCQCTHGSSILSGLVPIRNRCCKMSLKLFATKSEVDCLTCRSVKFCRGLAKGPQRAPLKFASERDAKGQITGRSGCCVPEGRTLLLKPVGFSCVGRMEWMQKKECVDVAGPRIAEARLRQQPPKQQATKIAQADQRDSGGPRGRAVNPSSGADKSVFKSCFKWLTHQEERWRKKNKRLVPDRSDGPVGRISWCAHGAFRIRSQRQR